jgi:hypothetical protein
MPSPTFSDSSLIAMPRERPPRRAAQTMQRSLKVIAPPHKIVHDPSVLPSLRELFSQHPAMTQSGTETLSRALHVFRFLPYCPETFEVEAALEALRVEGEIAA